jgi:hypothetical protein
VISFVCCKFIARSFFFKWIARPCGEAFGASKEELKLERVGVDPLRCCVGVLSLRENVSVLLPIGPRELLVVCEGGDVSVYVGSLRAASFHTGSLLRRVKDVIGAKMLRQRPPMHLVGQSNRFVWISDGFHVSVMAKSTRKIVTQLNSLADAEMFPVCNVRICDSSSLLGVVQKGRVTIVPLVERAKPSHVIQIEGWLVRDVLLHESRVVLVSLANPSPTEPVLHRLALFNIGRTDDQNGSANARS